MTKTKAFSSEKKLMSTVKEMTAADFLLEFDSIIEIDEMDNLLDANEGMCNLLIPVKHGNGNIYKIAVLFIDGQYDSWADC